MMSLLLTLIAITGCEDPVLEAAREGGGASPAAAEGGAGTRSGGHPIDGGRPAGGHPIDGGAGGADGVGVPEEPEPGDPGKPPPGEPGEPGPGIPDEPAPVLPGDGHAPPPIEGPAVTVSGAVELPDWEQGSIRIDVFDGDQLQLGGPRPGVVTMLTIEEPGPFTLEIPESVGRVWLSAFNDEDGDGRPGPVDPTGYFQQNPVSVEGGPVEGVVIVLERRDPPGGKVDEGL